jgi:hypothetical protein
MAVPVFAFGLVDEVDVPVGGGVAAEPQAAKKRVLTKSTGMIKGRLATVGSPLGNPPSV